MADNATLEEKAKNPSTPTSAYEEMLPKWKMIRTLLGGTAAMRKAGIAYLPQHPRESSANYQNRLSVTTLTNMTELTLDSLVGKPFSDPVKPGEDIPEPVKPLLDDVDLQGNNLTTFCRHWFRESIACGFSHVMIDFPKFTDKIDPATGQLIPRTLADDMTEGVRPYWVYLAPENVFAAFSETRGGHEILTEIRYFQLVQRRVGFAEVFDKEIMQVTEAMWVKYVVKKDANGKEVWAISESGPNPLGVIPLVTFYAQKEGLLLSKPPLEDLAYLNVRHWQSTSDQMNVLTVARFPMLAVSGTYSGPGEGKDSIAIGPRQLLATQAENGKFYYVEHTGAAIGAGADDLKKLERDMAAYGAEFLRERPGAITATARALDSAEATSPLLDMTLRFMDAIAMVLFFTTLYYDIKAKSGGHVLLTTDFGPDEINETDLRTLNEARRNRDLSRSKYIDALMRRGILPEDFDEEVNEKELQDEPQIASPFATGANSKGGNDGSNPDNTGKSK